MRRNNKLRKQTHSKLNNYDKCLLNKHLVRYQKLESGESKPNSANEEHFVRVFKNNLQPVSQHEIAYHRYKIASKKHSKSCKYLNGQLPTLIDEKTVDALDAVLINSASNPDSQSIVQNIKDWYHQGKSSTSNAKAEALVWLNYIVAENALSKSIERFSAENFNTLSNEYTKAIDGIFAKGLVSGPDHISPTLHRLILDGHTLSDAITKARTARQDDTNFEAVTEAFKALGSDFTSVVGLPITVLGKEKVDGITEILNRFGISDSKFADLLSLNVVELISSAIPAIALIFAWNDTDTKKFSEIVGALTMTSLYAGNPVSVLIVLVGLAKAFHKSKQEGTGSLIWAKAFAKGNLVSAVALISMNILGPVVWVTLLVALVAIPSLKAFRISVNTHALYQWITEKLISARTNPT